jgi:hypothetical protein
MPTGTHVMRLIALDGVKHLFSSPHTLCMAALQPSLHVHKELEAWTTIISPQLTVFSSASFASES